MDFFTIAQTINKTRDAFMVSSKTTMCMYCGEKIWTQDDWLPGWPEYDLHTQEFEYPAVSYHTKCEPRDLR